MSRNRRHQTAAVRFGPVLRVLALCFFVAGAGVGYVWQKEQINSLAERKKQIEIRLDQLRHNNDRLTRVLATLQSHGEIEARIKRSDLGLVAPQPDQIVRLVEVPPRQEMAVTNGERLYAAEHSAGLLRR
jgi:hypothetical protein